MASFHSTRRGATCVPFNLSMERGRIDKSAKRDSRNVDVKFEKFRSQGVHVQVSGRIRCIGAVSYNQLARSELQTKGINKILDLE